MARVKLTEEAREDMREIKEFSINEWGKAVARDYLNGMRITLQNLADNPGAGHDGQESLSPEIFSFPYARHAIYFTPVKNGIVVIGIIHQSRLPKALLQRKP